MGQFTQRKRHVVWAKIKNRKATGLDEMPPEELKARKFDNLLLRYSVIYCPSTKPSNKRCSYVNKPKSGSRWTLRKNIDRVPAAVSQSETGCQSEKQLADWGLCGPQWPTVEQASSRCERSASMVERRTWVNIAVRPCLHPSLTHNRTSPFRK